MRLKSIEVNVSRTAFYLFPSPIAFPTNELAVVYIAEANSAIIA